MKEFTIVQGSSDDIEQIADLYDAVNDYLENHINYPGWKKGIYPTKEDAQAGVKEGTLYVLWAEDKIAGSVVVNQLQEKGYETASWSQETNPYLFSTSGLPWKRFWKNITGICRRKSQRAEKNRNPP